MHASAQPSPPAHLTPLVASQADLQDPRTAQLIAETLTGAECKPHLDEVPALPAGSLMVASAGDGGGIDSPGDADDAFAPPSIPSPPPHFYGTSAPPAHAPAPSVGASAEPPPPYPSRLLEIDDDEIPPPPPHFYGTVTTPAAQPPVPKLPPPLPAAPPASQPAPPPTQPLPPPPPPQPLPPPPPTTTMPPPPPPPLPPPPPPRAPPPPPSSAERPASGSGRDDLFAQIRRGSALKHVDSSSSSSRRSEAAPSGGGRDDLFAQIRRGSALKHVDRSKPPKPTRQASDVAGESAAASACTGRPLQRQRPPWLCLARSGPA